MIFPLTFVSNVFVPIETLPEWLQPIAEWNPVSTLAGASASCSATRTRSPPDSFPGEHAILMSCVWTVGLLAVFGPLAVRQYRSIDR